ncbi:tyrosine-type recombinase/integrase [Noviherbaspirillum denitrificans]|nr:site-specific integrase [Noviherbaspirillum denitrificans]
MTNRQVRFTNKVCANLERPQAGSKTKEFEYTDTVTRAKLLVSKDRMTWYMRYTFRGNKRAIRLGEFPSITVEEAREMVIAYRAMLERGIDPQSQKDIQRKIPTLEDFSQKEYLPYAKEHKRSADMDESKLRLHILAKLGKKRLCDISRYDIDMYRTAIAKSHSPATSNRHLALLSRMFNLAIAWDRGVEKNPCNGIKKLMETSNVGRALKPDEINRLQAALNADSNVLGARACLLLMYSGLRHAEVLNLPWSAVELTDGKEQSEGRIFLEHTKSGRSRYVTLNQMAIDLLKSLPRVKGSPWVFPGKDPKKPMNNIKKVWARALAAGKVKPARIHDLRHSFASAAAVAGVSLYTIQKMLGHASSQTTQRYAHLADSRALREASMAAVTTLANAQPPASR